MRLVLFKEHNHYVVTKQGSFGFPDDIRGNAANENDPFVSVDN